MEIKEHAPLERAEAAAKRSRPIVDAMCMEPKMKKLANEQWRRTDDINATSRSEKATNETIGRNHF